MSVIDEIKARLDIVEVISGYVPLQRSGRNFKALCPFHSEKTPSFIVFPESQHWHCFGACNEGGDVFTFVMKREGWDFRTALEELARRAGVTLRPPTPAQQQAEQEIDRLRELLQTAARFYHHLLLESPEAEAARQYVARRGLSAETIEQFMLGYSPNGWDHTSRYLLSRHYTRDELLKAGLLIQHEETGSTYDRFRGRLMIPIRDANGHVIGFGARTLDPDGAPKYINSPQSVLFDKGSTLFGFDLARSAIHRQGEAVIVEGYMDVLQAHQAGFTNVVAQMGTALSEAQLKQLQRYARRIILALDPDEAGIRATLRGVEVAQEALAQTWEPVFDARGLVGYERRLGTEIRILRLPTGQDPDDVIRRDPSRWATLVEQAQPVVDFYLQVLTEGLDRTDTKAKACVVDTLLPVLQAVANPVERDDYIQKIARTLRVEVRAVAARLASTERAHMRAGRRPVALSPEPSATSIPVRGEADLEGYCLSLLLRRPELLVQVDAALRAQDLEPLSGQDFQDAATRLIFEEWKRLLAEQPLASPEELRACLPAELQAKLAELVAPDEPRLADELLVRDLIVTLLRLRQRNLRRLGQELGFLTAEAQEAGDLRAGEYMEALRVYRQTLLRIQRALARRWSLVPPARHIPEPFG